MDPVWRPDSPRLWVLVQLLVLVTSTSAGTAPAVANRNWYDIRHWPRGPWLSPVRRRLTCPLPPLWTQRATDATECIWLSLLNAFAFSRLTLFRSALVLGSNWIQNNSAATGSSSYTVTLDPWIWMIWLLRPTGVYFAACRHVNVVILCRY